ncbi:MAG TPA: type II toxin-antitoxin system VapB family antitoxin [Jatrophihabitantaceae bacterium]|nr:type II toxin-antitoxin system VapB family antitoxin [Jatrophihabitantaceae bacterium]
MKTTFDIPEPLLREVQRIARRRGTTTKSLVEHALRQYLDAVIAQESFHLRDASAVGSGLSDEFRDAPWSAVRAAAYGTVD